MTPTHTRRRGRQYRYYVCLGASQRGHDTYPVRSVAASEVDQRINLGDRKASHLDREVEVELQQRAQLFRQDFLLSDPRATEFLPTSRHDQLAEQVLIAGIVTAATGIVQCARSAP